jgi:membrane protease subunit (stomatin/prohibitin family)
MVWEDAYKGQNMMWRVPRNIRYNDNIVVREDEIAVFYRDGKALAYIDRPDRYALTSMNAPLVGNIIKFLTGVQQQAEVYYLQKRPFDGKFGSKQAYPFHDPDFQLVNLRVFGEFRYRVGEPSLFINQFVGTMGSQDSDSVTERIKEQMVILLYANLGKLKEKGMRVTDLAGNLTNIEQIVLEDSKSHFSQYGLIIDKISGLYISLPEEVQAAIDKRSSMAVLGTDYMGYQTGKAVVDAANNPSGGIAGAGVGLGAGMGMGYVMMDQMNKSQQQRGTGPAPAGVKCPKCNAENPPNMKFCGSCGTEMSPGVKCPKCGASNPAGMKFCGGCGFNMVAGAKCPKCNAENPPGTKFCGSCGGKLEG